MPRIGGYLPRLVADLARSRLESLTTDVAAAVALAGDDAGDVGAVSELILVSARPAPVKSMCVSPYGSVIAYVPVMLRGATRRSRSPPRRCRHRSR